MSFRAIYKQTGQLIITGAQTINEGRNPIADLGGKEDYEIDSLAPEDLHLGGDLVILG